MKQGENIDGYSVLHSISLDAHSHVVAQNTATEDERYRIYKINSGNLLGIADCVLVHEDDDYLKTMREFIKRLGAGLDVLGLDRMNRSLPHLNDAPLMMEDCVPGSSGLDFKGQIVAVKAGVLYPEYRAASHQLHIATGGFGCSPSAYGRRVYCKNIYDGEEVTFSRDSILGVVLPDRIPAWAREKIAKLPEVQTPQQQRKMMPSGEDISEAGDKPSVIDEIKQSKQEERERPAKSKDAPARKKTEPDL